MSYEFNDLLFNDQDDDTFFNLSSSKAEQQDQTTPQQNGSLSNEEFTPENFLDFDSSLYMGDIDKDYSSEEINTPTDNQDIVLSSTSTIGQDHVLNSSTDSMVEEFNKSVNVFTRKWSSSLDMEISTNSKIDVFLPVILKFVPEDKGLIPYEIRLQEVYAHYDLGLNHIKWQNQSTTLWCAEFESLPFPDLNSEYSNPLGGFKLIHTWAHPTWFRDCSGSSKTKMYLKLRKPNVGQNELIPFNDVKRFNFYNPPKSSRTLQVFNPEIQGVKKPIYPNSKIFR